jgi:peptidoglycan/xylan/chitin deacetylase (PgdA/CDA1 family)
MSGTRSPLRPLLILTVVSAAVLALSAAASPHHPGLVREASGQRAAAALSARHRARRHVPDATRRCPKAPYGPSFYAPGRGKTVALTFDDGPGRTTGQVLAMLRKYHVPATFFNIGENEASRRSLVRDEAKDGEALGNHTWNHPDMVTLSTSQQAAELDMTINEQKSIVGFAPCVFRPPYGDYDSTTLRLALHRRMGVWLWSVDTQDWMADGSGSSYWVDRIIRLAEQGGALRHPVVLMHNQPIGNPATVRALPTIIHFFRTHGYHFVRL